MANTTLTLWSVGIFLLYALGILTAVRAILEVRTSQGAIAWAMVLIFVPYLGLPAYWVLGRSRFTGFVIARRLDLVKTSELAARYARLLSERELIVFPSEQRGHIAEKLAHLPFTRGNDIKLLINGEATFKSIFAGIEQATSYVLVQFYILRDDTLGRALLQKLSDCVQRGVRCYVLYDEIGSNKLSGKYLQACRQAGIEIFPFNTTKGRANRLQLNFRNHRKIVVVDGNMGWVGGLNVGVEYLGENADIGPWRDTHVRVEGPAVQGLQITFVEDWHWATDNLLSLQWDPEPAQTEVSMTALAIPSGPADELETCTLFFIDVIHRAKQRLWISSPYFVPDEQIVSALQLAALRGVDVRIILPEKPDHILVQLSSWSYIPELENAGVQFFRYYAGFMHQKVMLIDDDIATVGTANFDNRSFRLNFEVTLLVHDGHFAAEVEAMLVNDLQHSYRVDSKVLAARGFWFNLAVKAARLMAPVQ